MFSNNADLKPVGFVFLRHLTLLPLPLKRGLICTALLTTLFVPQEAVATEYFENYSRFRQALTQLLQADQLPVSEGIMLKYRGTLVSFASHHGQIKSDDICYSVQYCDAAKYSKCMAAANHFFRETCETLQQDDSGLPHTSAYRQQYCDAVETLKNK